MDPQPSERTSPPAGSGHAAGAAGPPARRRWAMGVVAIAVAAVFAALQVVLSPSGVGLPLLSAASLCVALALCWPAAASATLALVSVLASLALAEFVLPSVLGSLGDGTVLRDPPGYWKRGDLGSEPGEGRFRAVKTTVEGEPIYDVVYTIGPDRFRVTPDNPTGPARVNFLGCSMTFGEGLQDTETLPYHFARRTDVQVHNYAFQGYGPQQALAILQGARRPPGHVNVFVTAPWHAMRSACKALWTIGSPRYERSAEGGVRLAGVCGDQGLLALPLAKRILPRSNLYRAVHQVTHGRASDEDLHLYVALVAEMARLSRGRGQRFVVAFEKANEVFFEGTSFGNDSVRRALAAVVDDVIDITLAPRAEAIERRHFLHARDRHPSAEANRERAALLAERIVPALSLAVSAPAAGKP